MNVIIFRYLGSSITYVHMEVIIFFIYCVIKESFRFIYSMVEYWFDLFISCVLVVYCLCVCVCVLFC